MNQHEKINYLELPSNNLGTTKIFFQQVFNWSFQDYGEQQKIEQAGGKIIEPTFSFPGGRRFHFSDPSNNEYAVWSDK